MTSQRNLFQGPCRQRYMISFGWLLCNMMGAQRHQWNNQFQQCCWTNYHISHHYGFARSILLCNVLGFELSRADWRSLSLLLQVQSIVIPSQTIIRIAWDYKITRLAQKPRLFSFSIMAKSLLARFNTPCSRSIAVACWETISKTCFILSGSISGISDCTIGASAFCLAANDSDSTFFCKPPVSHSVLSVFHHFRMLFNGIQQTVDSCVQRRKARMSNWKSYQEILALIQLYMYNCSQQTRSDCIYIVVENRQNPLLWNWHAKTMYSCQCWCSSKFWYLSARVLPNKFAMAQILFTASQLALIDALSDILDLPCLEASVSLTMYEMDGKVKLKMTSEWCTIAISLRLSFVANLKEAESSRGNTKIF